MTIQPLLHTEVNKLTELQPSGWPDILPIHNFYTNSDFCFPLKVVIDDKIAGIGTGIVHKEVGWLGHIIVHPDFRNKGLGRVITQSLIDLLSSKKCATLYLVATDLGEPVYKKLGFEIEAEYIFFKDLLAHKEWVSSGSIVPYESKFHQQIAIIDKFISGEDRMFHLDLYLKNGFVHIENGSVYGFYLPDFGDGMIQALHPTAGIELIKLRLSAKDNAVIPIDNSTAIEFMYRNHFKEFRKASRMRLGPRRSWSPQCVYNRIGGNLG
jgi:GNAT superfamily N-acetyltransferase